MTRAVYAKLWSMTDQYKSRRWFGFKEAWSSFLVWCATPALFVGWLAWPMVNFEWKKKLTFGLWVDPYRVRRYEGQEGFTARHGKMPTTTQKCFLAGRQKISKSNKAGLQFSVSRIARHLKTKQLSKRLSLASPIFLAAVIEYMCAEILELAGNAAHDQCRKLITPRHIQLAVRNDEELNRLFESITIPGGGVLPQIHSVLLPKKSKTSANEAHTYD